MIASIGSEAPLRAAEQLQQLLARRFGDLRPYCIVCGEEPFHPASPGAAGLSAANPETAEFVLAILPAQREKSIPLVRRLRASTGAKIAAVGAADDPQHILGIIHAGADVYLDRDGDLEAELNKLLTRFPQGKAASATAPARVISTISPSGGSGCSTAAVNLAAVLAREGNRCLLCDLDLFGGDLCALLNINPRHSIGDLCRNLHKLDQTMFEQSLIRHESGVSVLAAPQTCDDIECITWDAIRKILDLARTKFDYLVLDGENPFRRARPLVPEISDLIFLVFRLDFASLKNAGLALRFLDRQNIDPLKVRLVVNRSGQLKELPRKRAEDALQRQINFLLPEDSKTINSSINVGSPAVLEAPSAKISKAYAALGEAAVELVSV